jgi:hypothetical protein
MTTQHTEYLLMKRNANPARKLPGWAGVVLGRLSDLYGGARYQDTLPLFLRHNTPRIRVPVYYQDAQEAGFDRVEK